jgi:hypothetical protein
MRQMRQGRTGGRRPGWRTGWILSLLAVALAACAALPAAASAQPWSQPFDLSAPGAIGGGSFIYWYDKPPDVGLDDSGNATFAWRRLDATQSCGPNEGGCWQVQAVRRSASGVMSEVRTLSPPGIFGD